MIWLGRHAEGTGQAPDAPLSAEGARVAAVIVPRLSALGLSHVVSSPYARAREAVAPFAASAGRLTEVDARLSDREHGAVPPGACRAEAAEVLADPEARPFGGESISDLAARGQAALAEISASAPRPLVATHGLWLSVGLSAFGRPLDIETWQAMPRPALLELRDGRPRQLDLAP